MTPESIAIIGVAGGILGVVGFVISLVCVAMVAGFCRSTHTVQYIPHDNSNFEPEPEVLEDNEQALLDKVGKKKKEEPTVVENLDLPIEEITKTDIKF